MEQEKLFSTQEAAKKLGIKPPAFRMKALRAGFEPAKVIQGKGSPQKFWTAEQIATIAGNARADVTETEDANAPVAPSTAEVTEVTQVTDISTVEPTPVVITLDERANRIRELQADVQRGIIEIGNELIAAKEQVGHGNWSAWLEHEFSWSDRTARRFMAVAERFGKMDNVVRFQPSTLQAMLLLPEGTEQEFIDAQAAAGNPVETQSAREVQKNVKQFKQRRAAKKDSDNTEPVDTLQPVRADVDAEEPTPDLISQDFAKQEETAADDVTQFAVITPEQLIALRELVNTTNDLQTLKAIRDSIADVIALADAKIKELAQKKISTMNSRTPSLVVQCF